MLKKNQAIKIVITMLISLSVLFAGFFIYQNFNVKQPIEHSLDTVAGVNIKEISVDKNQVNIEVTLQQVEHLQQTYEEIIQSIDPYLKGRELHISFSNAADPQLMEAWNKVYFKIAEAIETHRYSLIPLAIEEFDHNNALDKVNYSMNDQHVFIDFHQGEHSIYMVIPKLESGGDSLG